MTTTPAVGKVYSIGNGHLSSPFIVVSVNESFVLYILKGKPFGEVFAMTLHAWEWYGPKEVEE